MKQHRGRNFMNSGRKTGLGYKKLSVHDRVFIFRKVPQWLLFIIVVALPAF